MIESTLATRLGVARQRAGMTQAMLANLLGLGAGSRISDWESGPTAPTAATLVHLPRVLGVNDHWLLTGVGPMAISGGYSTLAGSTPYLDPRAGSRSMIAWAPTAPLLPRL